MADTDNDQKTEQASERHLEEAMEQGRFAKVPELSVLLILSAALSVKSSLFAGEALND